MKVPIRRVDKELPLPMYKTAGAVAMDCCARLDTVIPPKTSEYVPLNIGIKPPRGHFVLMAPRSSLQKKGLIMANSIGLFDEDFSGDGDEYRAVLYNISDVPVELKRGDRIVQILVLPFDRVEWEEAESLGEPDRGGFGSTGIQ